MTKEIEIDVVGWFAVLIDGEPKAILETEYLAQRYIKFVNQSYTKTINYQIKPITRKVDFDDWEVKRILQGITRVQQVDADYAQAVLEKIQ